MSSQPGILVLNGPLPPPYGGIATYLAHALPNLVREGFTIHTVMDHRPADEHVYEPYRAAGVQIHYGGGSRTIKAARLISHLPFFLKSLKEWHLHPTSLPAVAQSAVSWIDRAETILKSAPIDIIHAYDYPWVQGFVAAFLARKYKKKFVQTTFGEIVPHKEELIHHDALGERYKPFVRTVLKEADAIVALSQHCAAEIEYIGVSRSRVTVMHWGVDVNEFRPRRDAGAARQRFGLGGGPVILFVGQIRPRKGPQVLLEAVPEILKETPDARVMFVGPDHGLLGYLKSRSTELGISSQTIFAGPQRHDNLLELYATCDVFVFPTCTPIECLGLSMIQAMACGKPVVGSRINGIPEVILNGETGYLVEPGNHAEIADRVKKLLLEPARRDLMGTAARRRAELMFDQDKLLSQLTNLYHSLLRS